MTIRLALLLALLLVVGCESTPAPVPTITVEYLYEGDRPPLDEVALVRVLEPDQGDGVGVVGSIVNVQTGDVFRPELRARYFLEVLPGRYEIDASFWLGRSRFGRTPSGEKALIDESLRAGSVVALQLVAEAGKIYYVRPELRETAKLLPAQHSDYNSVRYRKRTSQVERGLPDKMELSKDYLWRPHLGVLTTEEAREFWSYR